MVLFFTVMSASLDAYLIGLAFNARKRLSLVQTVYAGSYTFFACVIAMSFSRIFIRYTEIINMISGAILMFFGIKNICAAINYEDINVDITYGSVSALGLTVCMDAACVSACLVDENILLCSLAMCIAHTLLLYLSTITVKLCGVINKLSFVSGVFLSFLGIIRML